VPHISVQSLELHAGCLVVVAIQHSTSHNHTCCIRQLWEATSHIFARALTQIWCWSLVASPSLLPCLPNLACTLLQKHLHPLSPNPFGIIEIFQRQAVLKSLQKICNCRLPGQVSISQRLQIVQSPGNGPMLLLKMPSHPYILPLVECTKVGLPHPFRKLL
jgi:hypothetical protein